MVFNSKLKKEVLELKKALELQKSSLATTLYDLGTYQQIGAPGLNRQPFTPPTEPYVILSTCGPVGTVIHRITKTIAKFSWTSESEKLLAFLKKPNLRETFTSIIYKTVVDMLDYGEGFWDIANGRIHNVSPAQMKVEWDGTAETKKFTFTGGGANQPLKTEDVVHFILEPNSIELRGISKLKSIQSEINLYYFLLDASNKKFNRNQLPECMINLGPTSSPEQVMEIKNKLKNITHTGDIPVVNADMLELILFVKDHNFGTDFVNLQDWFERKVFTTFGMTDTDRGLISSTQASAEVHQNLTLSTIITPTMDTFQETFNFSRLTELYGGEFEWSIPKVVKEIDPLMAMQSLGGFLLQVYSREEIREIHGILPEGVEPEDEDDNADDSMEDKSEDDRKEAE